MRAVLPELPGLISMTPTGDLLDFGSRMGVGGRSDAHVGRRLRFELGSELPAAARRSDPMLRASVSEGLGRSGTEIFRLRLQHQRDQMDRADGGLPPIQRLVYIYIYIQIS